MPAMRGTGYLCSIAGKPAPTVGVAVHTTVQHTAPTGEWQLFRSQQICGSLACQRCGGPGACVQSLASQLPQWEWQCTPLFSTQLSQRERQLFSTQQICRSWLASDEGDWMSVFNPWQASSHKTQCPQGICGGLSDQKLAGVLALMISASSAPIFLKRWGSVVGK